MKSLLHLVTCATRRVLRGASSRAFTRVGAGVLLALAGVAPVPAAAQLALDRIEMTFRTTPGNPRLGVLNLRNEGNARVQAVIRLEDWERQEDGVNRWYPQGTVRGSCGKMLQIFPLSVSLDPGAAQPVRITLDSTAAVTKECWAAAVVETVQPRIEQGRNVNYLVRTAVKIYVQPEALNAEADVADMQIISADSGRLVEVVLENVGEQHLVSKGRVEFRRGDNSIAAKVELPDLYTLPGAKSRTRIRIPLLASGRYAVLAILDYGGKDLAAGQLEYEVP